MEYVYQLNLPSLETIFKKNVIKAVDRCPVPILKINPAEFFNDRILKIKNLNWNHGIVFKKHVLYRGPIHIDGYGNMVDKLVWGINWVHGGNGGMEYWENDYEQALTYDLASLPRLDIKTNKPADKIYPTISGKVYLINASIPHLAYNSSAYLNRYAVSIRDMDASFTWNQVVDLFSDLII